MIVNATHFIPVKEAAKIQGVTARTVHEWIRNGKIGYIKMGGTNYVQRGSGKEFHEKYSGLNIDFGRLIWVPKFAKQRKIAPRTIYEKIILGVINAVTLGDKVFVDPQDPSMVKFLETRKRKPRRKRPFF